MDTRGIERSVRDWLERVVIGLNLCPFAAQPYRAGKVRFKISGARTEEGLLEDLHGELARMDREPAVELETTLLIVPQVFADFDAYNQFLELVDALLEEFGWEGCYQVATFHPDYRFAGTASDDAGNLTNRSPYPILHLIREASIEQALEQVDDPAAIPARNIETVESLTSEQRRHLFPELNAFEYSPCAAKVLNFTARSID